MNIYKVDQNNQYGGYQYIVVAAEDEEKARVTKPEGETFVGKINNQLWYRAREEKFTITLIGEAYPGIEPGCLFESTSEDFNIENFTLILSSFSDKLLPKIRDGRIDNIFEP